jgi:hypothetical protein
MPESFLHVFGLYGVKIKATLLIVLVTFCQPKLHAQWIFDSTACFSNAFGLELTTSAKSLFACDTLTLHTKSTSGRPIIYWNNSVTGPTAFINMPGRYQAYAMDSKGCWDTTRSVEVTLHYNTPYTYSNNFSTIFCKGQELRITAVSLFPGRWNTQDTNREIAVRKGGKYYFIAKSDSGCIDTSTVLDLTEISVSKPDIKASGKTKFCLGDTVYLSTTSKNRISWYPRGYGSKIIAEYSGMNYAIATDSIHGCTNNSDTIEIDILQPYVEVLCAVTNDSLSGMNELSWNKTAGMRTKRYHLYRETSTFGKYDRFATVPYSASARYIDSSSNPRQRSYSYYIEAEDSCGNVSIESAYYIHTTMHLTASKGVNGENNLNWSPYSGTQLVTGYVVFRSNEGKAFVELDRLAANKFSFSDLNPPSGSNQYFIGLIGASTCANSRNWRLRSNQVQFGSSNTSDPGAVSAFRIFPNPTTGLLRVHVKAAVAYQITDASGRSLLSGSLATGLQTIELNNLQDGTYFLRTESGAQRFVIQR